MSEWSQPIRIASDGELIGSQQDVLSFIERRWRLLPKVERTSAYMAAFSAQAGLTQDGRERTQFLSLLEAAGIETDPPQH